MNTAAELDPTAETIAAAMAGDRAAVTDITRRYLPRVFALCRRITSAPGVAEEATQETFVRALRALPTLRDPSKFRSWLLMIAANTTRELGKAASKTVSLESEAAVAQVPVTRVPVADPDSRRLAVSRALGALTEGDRQLFLLHSVEGVALADLAREHGSSPQAMRSRVHRIRSKVRETAHLHLRREGRS